MEEKIVKDNAKYYRARSLRKNKDNHFAKLMELYGFSNGSLLLKIEQVCDSEEMLDFFKTDYIPPIHAWQISELKNGKQETSKMTPKSLIIIAKAMGISVDELLGLG